MVCWYLPVLIQDHIPFIDQRYALQRENKLRCFLFHLRNSLLHSTNTACTFEHLEEEIKPYYWTKNDVSPIQI